MIVVVTYPFPLFVVNDTNGGQVYIHGPSIRGLRQNPETGGTEIRFDDGTTMHVRNDPTSIMTRMHQPVVVSFEQPRKP